MALEKIADKVIETDVMVIGGGIAGCPAAAKAAEHGLKVTLVEKAKTDRSGSSAQGIDHYAGAFPRGMTPKEFIEITEKAGPSAYYGGFPWSDPTRIYRQYANGLWAIEELEKLGVTMKWDSDGIRPIHFMFVNPFIRVHWMNVKPEMAAGVRKRGVNVLERTMIVDLLTSNGTVVGATAVNSRTGEFIVIKAKATIIATAACSRIFNPETPVPWKYKFRYHWCPASVSGDGWAMAYRAGAELANMEQSGGYRRLRDDLNLSVGNMGNEGIMARLHSWDGLEYSHLAPAGFKEKEEEGKDPFYFSLESLPGDFHKRIEVAYVDERLVSFKIAEERGFNPKKHWYELADARPFQLHVEPGIEANADFETALPGLYAIGDCVAGNHDVANAASMGFLIGDSIHEHVNNAAEPVINEAQVEKQKEAALLPLSVVKDGTEPMELESAVRYICTRYIGLDKAEGKMREGSRRLGSLRREFLPRLMAKNPHYLIRALEVRNLMDVADLHLAACMERKETRDDYIRIDYPEKDPALEGMLLYQRLDNGKPKADFRKVKPMQLPDDHKEER